MTSAPKLDAIEIFGSHIVQQYQSHRAAHGGAVPSPLFVGMQGPQGSGKTTISRLLVTYLSSTPHNLRIAVLSTDDLYHTHSNLVSVARSNPQNKLLSGRGQPGTHDISLGKLVLESVAQINETKGTVKLPEFEKSLHGGEGDRAPSGAAHLQIQAPLDVFILEGWSMGFAPLTAEEVTSKYENASPNSPLKQHSLADLQMVNDNLKEYRDSWYGRFNVFLQIKPTDLQNVYIWRLQQEHAMKAANGGKGMSDEQVKAYMPGYLLFLDTISTNAAWLGRGKSVVIDLSHSCIASESW